MKHLFLLLSFFFALILIQNGYAQQNTYKAGEILVKYKSGVVSATKSAIGNRHNARLIRSFPHLNVHHMELPEGTDVLKAVRDFQSDPNVEYAEPNFIRRPFSVTPNDPAWQGLWGMIKIGMPDAWIASQGSPTVKVAIVDTGIDYTHPELAANIWMNPGEIAGNGIDDDGNGMIDDVRGWNFFSGNNDPMDTYGHGTHVAGIIGAIGNNALGVAGVNWTVSLIPARFMDANGGTISGEVAAIDYAAKMGARIMNASFGDFTFSQTEYDAIQLYSNVLFVAAAGNSSSNSDTTPTYPAAYNLPNIIAVAASDSADQLASFSNHGATTIHLAAPGVSIASTVPAVLVPTQAEPNLDLTGPLVVSGGTGANYAAMRLGFAGHIPGQGITARVYDCGIGAASTDCPPAVSGNIALIERDGSLTFRQKVTSAMNAGAIAAIIYDNQIQSAIFPGTLNSAGNWIPAVSVTNSTGHSLKAQNSSAISLISPYDIYRGTSMATPFVTGVAALLLAEKPDLSVAEMKEVILQSVDAIPSLSGYVASGGRLNAARALGTVRKPPYQLMLKTGWNLVSFPKLPTDPSVSQVFSPGLSDKVRIIWAFDGSTRHWKKWKPYDAANSGISHLEFGRGYWVYMDQDSSINLSGWSTPLSYSIPLLEGWNLAAYQGQDRAALSTELNSINNNWSMIWGWDEGQWSAQAASITLPAAIPLLSNFYQGKAYWIQIKQGMSNVNWNQSR